MEEEYILMLELVVIKENGLMDAKKEKEFWTHMEICMKENGIKLNLVQENTYGIMVIVFKDLLWMIQDKVKVRIDGKRVNH
jgi:hypothetical protein